MGFFEKIKQGLSKTASSISSVFTASELDDDFYDDLEERLILADLGMDTTVKAVERLRLVVRDRRIKTVAEAREALREVLCDMLDVGDSALNLSTKPSVVLCEHGLRPWRLAGSESAANGGGASWPDDGRCVRKF